MAATRPTFSRRSHIGSKNRSRSPIGTASGSHSERQAGLRRPSSPHQPSKLTNHWKGARCSAVEGAQNIGLHKHFRKKRASPVPSSSPGAPGTSHFNHQAGPLSGLSTTEPTSMLFRIPTGVACLVLVQTLFISVRLNECATGGAKRGLLGNMTQFEEEKLRDWGVPANAQLLMQSRSSCENPPPVEAAAKMAQLCDSFQKIRECINVSDTHPFIGTSGCRGRECVMRMNTADEVAATSCFFKYLTGTDVDVKNKSRKATCGVDPEDAFWFEPGIDPSNVGSVSCIGALPEGVQSFLWAECKERGPVYLQKLMFDRNISDKSYTCILSPQCRDGMFISEGVCYTDGTKQPKPAKTEVELDVETMSQPSSNVCMDKTGVNFVVFFVFILSVLVCIW